MPTEVEVAAGVIVGPRGVLLSRRPPGAHLAGRWEFPGGKRQPGEDLGRTLRRELREELGIRAEVGPLLRVVEHTYAETGRVRLYFYLCRVRAGTPRPLAASEVRWFAPEALAALDLPAADRPVVEWLAAHPHPERRWTAAARRGHPVFAWAYDALAGGAERLIGSERRRLVRVCRGRVLELGVGTGASFPYWAEALRAGTATTVAGVEPDPHMRARAERRAWALRLPLPVAAAAAEQLPFAAGSMDAVACFLVLCSVADPRCALAEAFRVLRPGGILVFLEHVRAEGPAARWQAALERPWRVLGAGCHLTRRTDRDIAAAGFALSDLNTLALPFPLCRAVAGVATRPDLPPPPDGG